MTREEELKSELKVLSKLAQLEARRTRAIEHSLAKLQNKYDEERTKFLAMHPNLDQVLRNEGDATHASYLERLAASVPVEETEEVSDAELVTE